MLLPKSPRYLLVFVWLTEYICFLSQLWKGKNRDQSRDLLSLCKRVRWRVCVCVDLSIRTGVGASIVSFHNSSSPVSHFCASATESTAK